LAHALWAGRARDRVRSMRWRRPRGHQALSRVSRPRTQTTTRQIDRRCARWDRGWPANQGQRPGSRGRARGPTRRPLRGGPRPSGFALCARWRRSGDRGRRAGAPGVARHHRRGSHRHRRRCRSRDSGRHPASREFPGSGQGDAVSARPAQGRFAGGCQRDRARPSEQGAARTDAAVGGLAGRAQHPHRRRRIQQAAPRVRRLIRLAVRVRSEQAELVLAELLELAPSGVEEVAVQDGSIEYAVYGAPGELPALPALRAAAGDALVDVTSAEIGDDWRERWRSYHRPAGVGNRLTVRPPWEPAGTTPLDVVIDPGQAFGTGAHATTRLCLELLLEVGPPGSLLDLGCGSGVLAITAAKLGYNPVLAVDLDPAAVAAASANAELNAVDIEVLRLDLRSQRAPCADTIVANLLAPLLERWAGDIAGGSYIPRRIIAGGLLTGEGDSVADAFAPAGLREARRLTEGGWAALLLESAPT